MTDKFLQLWQESLAFQVAVVIAAVGLLMLLF